MDDTTGWCVEDTSECCEDDVTGCCEDTILVAPSFSSLPSISSSTSVCWSLAFLIWERASIKALRFSRIFCKELQKPLLHSTIDTYLVTNAWKKITMRLSLYLVEFVSVVLYTQLNIVTEKRYHGSLQLQFCLGITEPNKQKQVKNTTTTTTTTTTTD